MTNEAIYLWKQISQHVARFFTKEAQDILDKTKILFVSYDAAIHLREQAIAIPIDVSSSTQPIDLYQVPFNGTMLTLWNRLPMPSGEGWSCLPNADTPIWYQHEAGTLVPSWNLFANLFDLLTLREERESTSRDIHGRFVGAMSPRQKIGLLEVPAFNEAVAAIVAASISLHEGGLPKFDLPDSINPPLIALSHDNDILRGNDMWTQAVRFYRIFQPLIHGRPPHVANFWWMLRNAVHPKDFYLDNIGGMIEIERMLGFVSSFYFLNGRSGRFGARSGTGIIDDAIRQIPDNWNVGIHYNYDTLLDTERFDSQIKELSLLLKKKVVCGRAHYLRFDPEKSFSFLAGMGILCDETVGYPDSIGYRSGIAGVYQPYDYASRKAVALWEVPLVVMDEVLINQYPENPVGAFRRLVTHISRVGGAISLLFHPGVFYNPEFPEAKTIYRQLLGVARDLRARGTTALSLLPGT